MKLTLISLIIAVAPAFAAEAPKDTAPKAEAKKAPAAAVSKDPYKNDDERGIYTIGYLMGRNIASFSLTPAEVKIVQAGLADAILGAQPKIDVRFYQPRVNEILNTRMSATAGKEKEKGRAFTEKFVKESKPQAIVGGGWYLETKAGTGPMPAKTDTVRVHYRGTFIDGSEFDSSYSRGTPSDFSIAPGGVIDCWTNGIPMLKVGGKAKLVCPSDVAYKDAGRSGIKGGATLIFEVELVDIIKPEATKK